MSRSLRLIERLQLSGAGDRGRAQAVLVVNRHAEPLHERTRVLAEPLLPRDERVAVVRILHRPLLEVARHADVVVRTEDQARAFACEPLAQRLDFLRGGLLFGDQMIEAEHHQRVRVLEHACVDRQLLPGLVDALIHGDGMSRQLADQLLKPEQRQMEQLERAGDALQEHLAEYSGVSYVARPLGAPR